MARGRRRAGVAAESVDSARLRSYVGPVYPKDDGTRELIRAVLRGDARMQVLLGHVDVRVLEDVVDAFQHLDAPAGQELIAQGQEGDRLYVLELGAVDVFVRRGQHTDHVARLREGALFGELALLYEAPRQATVRVASDWARLWALDREPFRLLLCQSEQRHRALYEGWLRHVPVLARLTALELARLGECLEPQSYRSGEVIARQGDPGDRFFLLEDGACAAFIDGPQGEQHVATYGQGDYFGELALLREEPRRATVRATGRGAMVVSLSKDDFTSLLGPIQDILQEHAEHYSPYLLG